MISSLRGEVNKIWKDKVEILVGGIGYLVIVGDSFLKKYVEGDEVEIKTYLSVSENEWNLFGFENWEEVSLFKMLISVSGVGPKTGAVILGSTSSSEVSKAIFEADVKFFEKIKGIGKKTAQRIIIDLKSKIGGIKELDLSQGEVDKDNDLYLSLKQLGFDKKEIEKVIFKLPKDIIIIEEQLEWCLKNL
jgi:Holliday junction DNA helicase RuvA